VVAVVWLTKHGDIVVDWHDNGYRTNVTVLDLIKESKSKLLEEYANQKEKISTIKVQATWEFEVDVGAFNPKFVDIPGLAFDLTKKELKDKLNKKELTAEDFSYAIVEQER